MSLLVSQKDMFFDIIEKHNAFTPFQFKLYDNLSGGDIIFEFKESPYYFNIFASLNYIGVFTINYTPGEKELIKISSGIPIDPSTYTLFSYWLDNLEREIKAPNKWERLTKEIESMSFHNGTNDNDEKFSYQEYTEVTSNILILKEGIKEIGLSPEQYNIINDKLDFLIEQGKSLKKFDWRSLFIGTMMNIMTNIIVNPTTIIAFKDLINNFFTKLLA